VWAAISVLEFLANFVELLILRILEVALRNLFEVERRAGLVGMEPSQEANDGFLIGVVIRVRYWFGAGS
jgi:hypothetical protein